MIEEFKTGMINSSKKYSNIVLLCEDDLYDVEYSKSFPSRQFHLGSSVRNVIAMAAGFASRGKLPFVLINSDRILASVEEIQKLLVEGNLNVKLIGIGGDSCLSVLNSIDGLEVKSPENAEELSQIVAEFANSYGPSYLALKA